MTKEERIILFERSDLGPAARIILAYVMNNRKQVHDAFSISKALQIPRDDVKQSLRDLYKRAGNLVKVSLAHYTIEVELEVAK